MPGQKPRARRRRSAPAPPRGQRPHAESGTLCPFLGKDVAKVCHQCELWAPLPVGRVVANHVERFDYWACSFKHHTFVLRDIGTAIDGLQKAEESFRNTAWNESQKNLNDIVETVKHQNKLNGDLIRNLGEALSEMARAIEAREPAPRSAINGNAQHAIEDQS